MKKMVTDPSYVADLAQKAGESILTKGGPGRDLVRLGERMDTLIRVVGKRTDGQQIRTLMDELITAAKSRLDNIVQTLITETGATRADAELAAEMTPLGRQLIELRDAAMGLRMSAERTGSQLDDTDVAKALGGLGKSLQNMAPTEAVIEAICKVDATLAKIRSGGQVSKEWIERVRLEASQVIDGKVLEMTKQNTAITPIDALEKAERDQFGNVKDPAATLDAMIKASAPNASVIKSGSASERLDGLAKSLADKEGIDFYDAYERVGSEHPELLANAVAE